MDKFQNNYADRKNKVEFNLYKTVENANYSDRKQIGAYLGEGDRKRWDGWFIDDTRKPFTAMDNISLSSL